MSSWVVALAAVAVASQPALARFKAGALPEPPAHNVGGGEVLLEVALDAGGRVTAVRTLRDTPPYTEAMRGSAGSWTFEPARNAQGEGIPSGVLVAGSFRPPTSTGPAAGQPPKDVAAPSSSLPFPVAIVPALYPPQARGDAQVLVEMTVAADGTASAQVVRGADGFNEAALQAAGQWRFRATPGRAYALFGFRQPVGTMPPPPVR
jgi:TonB family protein